MESLKSKTVKGISWSFIDAFANQGITFLVGLILARLLSPAEFGIIGIIGIFIAVSNTIVDSGFSNALIRKPDAQNIDYNTVFYFNLLIGVLFYGLIFLFAPVISSFFNEPLLTPLSRVLGIVLIINAFGIIQKTLLTKNIDFKKQTNISLIASVTSGIVGIVMAFSGYGVWSLAGQQLSRQGLNTVFLWIYNKWRPVLEFSIQSFKELFGFGSKLLLSGLLETIYQNIHTLVIGKYFSAAQLGQYSRANQFKSVFSSNLTAVFQRVYYPILSQIQNEQDRLLLIYRRIIKTNMLISFTMLLGLAAISKPLIVILIGEKWLMAAKFLPILCFAGMLYPLHATNLNILQVKGYSNLFLKLEIVKKMIGCIPIVIGIFYGIEIMLWSAVIVSFVSLFVNGFYSKRLLNYSMWEQLKDIFPSFSISSSIAFIVWSCQLLNIPYLCILILQSALGLFLTLLIHHWIKLPEYLELKDIALSFFYDKRK
jgi:O-antigen/teichoic acid export membrane protein